MESKFFLLVILPLFISVPGGKDQNNAILDYPTIDREEIIPVNIAKQTPRDDLYPPIFYSTEISQPIPLSTPVNTAGAEDSPFILPDGKILYLFFTPDVRVPPEDTLKDQVSGVWVSQKSGDIWEKPKRVWLQKPDVLALDGAVNIQANEMWFASAREGYVDINMFTAEWNDDPWTH